jgi:hypothetical protein
MTIKRKYRPVLFAAHGQPLCWNFLYHSRIVLFVGGSVWYLVRNLRCTITIKSNSKTQNAFLSPILAMFRHDCLLVVKLASTPGSLLPKLTWRDSVPIDMLLAFCCVCLGCCAAEFRNSGGTYELPCITSRDECMEPVAILMSIEAVVEIGEFSLFDRDILYTN